MQKPGALARAPGFFDLLVRQLPRYQLVLLPRRRAGAFSAGT